MQTNIGIPRALLYHEYGGLWTAFFQSMGVPVTVSGETDKQILDRGTALSVDESCLPLKVYLGHVDSLLSRCTHIFVPRVSRYDSNFYLCAKFAGLPDIVRNTFRQAAVRIVTPNIEGKSWSNQLRGILTICQQIGLPPLAGYLAYRRAIRTWRAAAQPGENLPSGRKVAVIGHNYLLKDDFLSRNIGKTLAARKVAVVRPEDLPSRVLYSESSTFMPDIYWQLSAKIAGATRCFSRRPDIAGIIMLSSFSCGPDSLVNEYLEHHVLKDCGKPYLIVNIDEHTGNAGMITRIEAFADLLERGGGLEGNVPPYGVFNHSRA